jgi:hypothetical protein
MIQRTARVRLIAILSAAFVAGITHKAAAEQSVGGTVVSASGKPVDGAEVIVATRAKHAWPNLSPEERDEPRQGAATALTDKSGRFTLPLPDGAALLSVNHPTAGYAELRPETLATASEPIKLEPWCKVEGTVKIGAKPAPAGTKVSIGVFGAVANAARVNYACDTATDGQGHYVLDHVPAGVHQIRVKASKTGSTLEQYVYAEPGKTVRFDVGGRGRPVVGKLVLNGYDVKDLSTTDGAARLRSISYFRRNVAWPSPPRPDGNLSPQDREDAMTTWRRTPETFEQWKDQYRCNIEFQPDGSFRFDDVPPGAYTLMIQIYPPTGGNPIAVAQTEVTVPDAPAVPTDEPVNLGEQRLGGGDATNDGKGL